jgi:hypothetical protein
MESKRITSPFLPPSPFSLKVWTIQTTFDDAEARAALGQLTFRTVRPLILKRGLSHLLNDQHRQAVRLNVVEANDLKRPPAEIGIVSPGLHTSTVV